MICAVSASAEIVFQGYMTTTERTLFVLSVDKERTSGWLAVGQTFGGPLREDRPVLALATACRHPAVAIAIATTMFPNEQLVGAAVLADLLIAAVVTVPYVRMSRRGMETHPPARRATDSANAATPSHHRA